MRGSTPTIARSPKIPWIWKLQVQTFKSYCFPKQTQQICKILTTFFRIEQVCQRNVWCRNVVWFCGVCVFQIEKYVPTSKLKYYFAVDTAYVGKKIGLLLFPYAHAVSENLLFSARPNLVSCNRFYVGNLNVSCRRFLWITLGCSRRKKSLFHDFTIAVIAQIIYWQCNRAIATINCLTVQLHSEDVDVNLLAPFEKWCLFQSDALFRIGRFGTTKTSQLHPDTK